MRKFHALALTGAAAAMTLTGAVASPAMAADAYNATIAGQRSFSPLVNLVQSSTLTVDITNLPANVGLYALHCKVPADPRAAPTACDTSPGAFAYLPAIAEARASVALPIKVNAEFWGTNPNPTGAPAAGESVDCRAATADPRSTACAVYVLGAGRDSANPAYLRVFPTVFTPVSADRKTDVAVVSVDGAVLGAKKVTLTKDKPVAFSVKTKSGLTAYAAGDNCSVAGGTITALKAEGTCTVRITTTGGKFFTPIVTTRTFALA